MRHLIAAAALAGSALSSLAAGDGNRLTYLDDTWNIYYVNQSFPKLVTPQWVGDEGVECVITLGIDDMRGPEKWETFLRPILNRLKKIDGRAPVSIMTCQVDPKHPQLQTWLKEGLSLETHTLDHPMPLFRSGSLAKVKETYDRCVDLMNEVPNNKPVAFRVPACDSLNTPSPRFYLNVFNKKTDKGHFLELDSSVCNVFSPADNTLPAHVFQGPEGADRFRKYLPSDRTFVNTIENYPYPYVLGGLCWEFPCVTPTDWSAQHLHKPNNSVTVADWKAALDCCVAKQGTFNLVFHPHGWIKAEQVIDLIDYGVEKYGKRVKFLTFRECRDRLTKNLLGGVPLRNAKPHTHYSELGPGDDNGVRLIDLDNDGFLDVIVGNRDVRKFRIWSPTSRRWIEGSFPSDIIHWPFGVIGGQVCFFSPKGSFRFDGKAWIEDDALLNGVPVDVPVTRKDQVEPAVTWDSFRLRDLDGDNTSEMIVKADLFEGADADAIFRWRPKQRQWTKLEFHLPPGARYVPTAARDSGVRFVDFNKDGFADVIFSNQERFGVYLWDSMRKGWSHKVMAGRAGEPGALPFISRGGADNGFWVHSDYAWWSNEDTALLKDHVDRRSFDELTDSDEPTGRTAEASHKMLQPRPGFKAELVAAEPLVQDPIAFAWGPDRKLWVVEMGDYPLGIDGKGKPGGRIKFLEDIDGDGKYDTATVFLDGLPFPTGVLPWRKGVLVTCAPDIFYAEDTDGDGKADKKEVLFTGFVPGNQQHRVNSLVWGLDNWIYVANGDSGGTIRSVKTGKQVAIRGRDLRINPDTGEMEAVTGQTQYGRSRDDWGNWFGGNNSNPAWHFALEDHYLRRNPYFAPPDPRVSVSVTPGAATVFPISRTLPRFNSPQSANHFTSACSPVVYRDELFGPEFAGNIFVSEPVHNLVHREVVTPAGSTFTSRRAADEQKSEFLASRDNWFRPTMIQTGPDGALWVADMYRAVIEHPEWIPLDWQKKLDLRAGYDQGRIYRVYPENATPRAIPRLSTHDAEKLVAALDNPNGWQRDTAHMMLIWRQDRSAVNPLRRMAAEAKRPQARLHALCILDGLGQLEPADLAEALHDKHAGVRRHAVRLSERRLGTSPRVAEGVLKLAADPDPLVRMQVAYSLGYWNDARAGEALGRLLAGAAEDQYLTAAALSSVNRSNLDAVLLSVLRDRTGTPAAGLLHHLLRLAAAMEETRAIGKLLTEVGTPARDSFAGWQFTALGELLDALDAHGTSLDKLAADDESLRAAVQRLGGLFAAARTLVNDDKVPPADRARAVVLLGRTPERRAEDLKVLAGLLAPQAPDEVQRSAVAVLARMRDPEAPGLLLQGWKGYTPGLRAAVLDALLGRAEGVKLVLAALEQKTIRPREVDAVRAQRLLQSPWPPARQRAEKLLAGTLDADRQKVIDSYKAVLTLRGDAGRGKELFAKNCAACHQFAGAGNAVGPDLASLGDKSSQSLLIAVLDPNRAVEARYQQYRAETKDGQVVVGVLTAETGTSVTLAGDDGKPRVLLRQDIEALAGTGKSAMPEGLERQLQAQELADLFEHLRAASPAPKPKVFEGNKPAVVKAEPDGSLKLLPASAEIYGPSLVLEKQYGNLGYWMSAEDHADWEVEVPRAGKYAVWLDWACDNGSAGSRFKLQVLEAKVSGIVAGTGTWDTYKQVQVGELDLRPGRQHLVFRSEGKVTGALIDLRGIRLVRVP